VCYPHPSWPAERQWQLQQGSHHHWIDHLSTGWCQFPEDTNCICRCRSLTTRFCKQPLTAFATVAALPHASQMVTNCICRCRSLTTRFCKQALTAFAAVAALPHLPLSQPYHTLLQTATNCICRSRSLTTRFSNGHLLHLLLLQLRCTLLQTATNCICRCRNLTTRFCKQPLTAFAAVAALPRASANRH